MLAAVEEAEEREVSLASQRPTLTAQEPPSALPSSWHADPKALPCAPWLGGPPRLWSLEEMIQFRAPLLYLQLQQLQMQWASLGFNSDGPPPSQKREKILELMGELQDSCLPLGLRQSAAQAKRIAEVLGRDATVRTIQELIFNMHQILFDELSEQEFAFVPAGRASFFEQDALFGDKVKDAFGSAAVDIKEAGSCFATGAYTATVFHLMRAVEWALRALARDLKITFPEPIEVQEWGTIIDKIQAEAALRCNAVTGKGAKIKARDFYNGAIGEARGFKDAWRNHVMHARESYDEGRAQSAMNHVREFMQRLVAGKLSESRRTPIRWK